MPTTFSDGIDKPVVDEPNANDGTVEDPVGTAKFPVSVPPVSAKSSEA